jgi:hypothetical protein
MNYTNVTNPQWATADHSSINCIVDFEGLGNTPFTANPNDTQSYGVEIFNACVAGEYGVIAEYVPPAPYIPTAEVNKATAVNLLTQTDWTSIADVANPAVSNPYLTNQAEFLAYRSQLRAIAVNPTAGFITFPTKPQEQWS